MAEALTSTRRRVIYDSESITAASIGSIPLFQNSAGKGRLLMWPVMDGKMPDRQRFLIDGIAIAFPSGYAQVDAAVLDGIVVTLEVEDGEGQRQKIRGLPRNFPAGGGVAGAAAIGDDGVTVEAFNNGRPTAQAIYTLNPPQEVAPNIAFRVDVNIPVALAGITTGRIYGKLTGLWTYFLKGKAPETTEARDALVALEAQLAEQRRRTQMGILLPESSPAA